MKPLGISLLLTLSFADYGTADRRRPEKPKAINFKATAYSLDGFTKSGAYTRVGMVAADPKILPLGSVIRVTGAGMYDGIYRVTDTGRKVKGRHIDLYIEDNSEAKEFGKCKVKVEVLELGSENASAAAR